ncbi:MAG: ACP S-malonyltransferase [Spirochaetota bacterium]|nr:ACP S-malonyltransferase [Spirochaetota bacterium]
MVLFFPGQGSQFVGMGKELVEKYKLAQDIYTQANDILGFNIQNLSFEGPEDDLINTKNAQPAILTYQYILISLLKVQNIVPTALAGHSLGEFSALLASEMLSFEDTLKLVQKRGQLMAEADPHQKGGMAVVLGLDDNSVINICKEVSNTYYVEPVNFNTPGQVVISGLKEGITLASEKLSNAGAKRVLALAVSGAFHSKLMEEASIHFEEFVNQLNFSAPLYPIVSNVTAEFYDESTVKQLLALQMKSPVQWVSTVNYLVDKGFDTGIEMSTGTIIQGMVKKINKEFAFIDLMSLIS